MGDGGVRGVEHVNPETQRAGSPGESVPCRGDGSFVDLDAEPGAAGHGECAAEAPALAIGVPVDNEDAIHRLVRSGDVETVAAGDCGREVFA
ncbi:MAG: hypothetical protein R2729_09620 [Bryobacteraceae bacterium]